MSSADPIFWCLLFCFCFQNKIESRKQARARRISEEQQAAQEGSSEAAVAAALAAEIDMNERDVEMENELVKKLSGDAISDYDIEVNREGEAIAEYMSLLDSPAQLSNGSSL